MEIQVALAAVPLSVARPFVKGWDKNGVGVKAVRKSLPKNSKGYRVYIPIKKVKSDKPIIPPMITDIVESQGYKIDDYVTGVAVSTDGRRVIRIGKLLNKTGKSVRQAFENDPQRSAYKDSYVVVISAHPYDVIGMSTGRRWDATSCLRLGTKENGNDAGSYSGEMKGTVAEGTLVAYVLQPNDRNIKKPIARLLIKPFKNPHNDGVYFAAENNVYGTPVPGFKRTVEQWLKKINKGAAAGIYKLHDRVHADGIDRIRYVGKFNEVADPVAYMEEHYHDLPGKAGDWINIDKRWAAPILKAAWNSSTLLQLYHTGLSAQALAKVVDENADIETQYDFLYESVKDALLTPKGRDVVRASKVLTEIAEPFNWRGPDEEQSGAFVKIAAHWDSRWLANIQNGLNGTAQFFVRALAQGALKWTPEFQNSKFTEAQELRKYAGFLLAIIIREPSKTNWRVNVRSCRSFIRNAKVPMVYSREMDQLMAQHKWRFIKYMLDSGVNVEGQLLAEIPSWADHDPEMLMEASHGNFVFSDDTMKKFIGYAKKNREVQAALVHYIYARRKLSVNEGWTWVGWNTTLKKYLASVAESDATNKIKDYAERALNMD